MLGGNLAGVKLPPFIIFKGVNTRMGHVCKELDKGEGNPDDVGYGVQEKAWMDKEMMLEWIEKIWNQQLPETSRHVPDS
jgi:DDE superfamily endonuclease